MPSRRPCFYLLSNCALPQFPHHFRPAFQQHARRAAAPQESHPAFLPELRQAQRARLCPRRNPARHARIPDLFHRLDHLGMLELPRHSQRNRKAAARIGRPSTGISANLRLGRCCEPIHFGRADRSKVSGRPDPDGLSKDAEPRRDPPMWAARQPPRARLAIRGG